MVFHKISNNVFLTALIFMAVLRASSGLKCYLCTNLYGDNCGTRFNSSSKYVFKGDCSSGDADNTKYVCWTSMYISDGPVYNNTVVRTCLPLYRIYAYQYFNGCINEGYTKYCTYTCNTDLCNDHLNFPTNPMDGPYGSAASNVTIHSKAFWILLFVCLLRVSL